MQTSFNQVTQEDSNNPRIHQVYHDEEPYPHQGRDQGDLYNLIHIEENCVRDEEKAYYCDGEE